MSREQEPLEFAPTLAETIDAFWHHRHIPGDPPLRKRMAQRLADHLIEAGFGPACNPKENEPDDGT